MGRLARVRDRGGALPWWGLVVLAALVPACAKRAEDHPPRATLLNASGAELRDVAFIGDRGLIAPVVARVAPGDSIADTLGVMPMDAVFVTYVANGRAHVSDDSASVDRRLTRAVRFVVDSSLRARVTGVLSGP
jgi:hypothetical protein